MPGPGAAPGPPRPSTAAYQEPPSVPSAAPDHPSAPSPPPYTDSPNLLPVPSVPRRDGRDRRIPLPPVDVSEADGDGGRPHGYWRQRPRQSQQDEAAEGIRMAREERRAVAIHGGWTRAEDAPPIYRRYHGTHPFAATEEAPRIGPSESSRRVEVAVGVQLKQAPSDPADAPARPLIGPVAASAPPPLESHTPLLELREGDVVDLLARTATGWGYGRVSYQPIDTPSEKARSLCGWFPLCVASRPPMSPPLRASRHTHRQPPAFSNSGNHQQHQQHQQHHQQQQHAEHLSPMSTAPPGAAARGSGSEASHGPRQQEGSREPPTWEEGS
mmetsp:Transcript_39570/g.112848  ORF Transcript_39570/g.112848 Transcript_39570/m.112848 type:complete len:328 (-) Transcript_39570:76-1059(-)